MQRRQSKLYIYFSLLMLLTIMTSNVNPFLAKEKGLYTFKTENNKLYEEIKKHAEAYHEAPMNAYIDRVWKKTPGRNGRSVNLEASYKKIKKHGSYSDDLLVFDEKSPTITLDDLPPAPIYRGHPEKEMVALLINVSWGEEHIPSMLETLKEANVKATFFIEGKWAAEHKSLVEMIDEEKHVIGNHAYNHPDMNTLTEEQMEEQIEETNDILEAIIDERPHYFAPPSGSFNDQVVHVADELDMETILWTVDTIDWQNPSVSVMIDRVTTNIHPGATVLMHPTEPVRKGLEEMIHDVKASGYAIGTIESLLDEHR